MKFNFESSLTGPGLDLGSFGQISGTPSVTGITFNAPDSSPLGHVKFDDPENPSARDLIAVNTPPLCESFEVRDGKIRPKYVPIRDRIKAPAGRTDYGWDHNMRRKHLASAWARNWPEFPYGMRANNGVLHIVGGGPSLKRCIKQLRRYSEKPRNFILALNKTHDFLLDLPKHKLGPAIKVWGAALLDPCDWVKDYITPRPGVQYFIGDQCAPATFDVFEKPGITKWIYRATNPEKDKDIVPQDRIFITGGSTVGMRMRTMAYYMGFREIHLWGFDSSAEVTKDRPDGKMHGYDKLESVKDRVSIKVVDENGFEKEFITNTHMARQAQEFLELRDVWINMFRNGRVEWVKEIFHGDGLLPTIAARLGMHADRSQNYTDGMVPLVPGTEILTTQQLRSRIDAAS